MRFRARPKQAGPQLHRPARGCHDIPRLAFLSLSPRPLLSSSFASLQTTLHLVLRSNYHSLRTHARFAALPISKASIAGAAHTVLGPVSVSDASLHLSQLAQSVKLTLT